MKEKKLLWIPEEADISDETCEWLLSQIDKLPKDSIKIVSSPTKTNPFYDKYVLGKWYPEQNKDEK